MPGRHLRAKPTLWRKLVCAIKGHQKEEWVFSSPASKRQKRRAYRSIKFFCSRCGKRLHYWSNHGS